MLLNKHIIQIYLFNVQCVISVAYFIGLHHAHGNIIICVCVCVCGERGRILCVWCWPATSRLDGNARTPTVRCGFLFYSRCNFVVISFRQAW